MGDSFYSPDPSLVELQNWKGGGTTGRNRSSLDPDLFAEACAPTFTDVQLYLAKAQRYVFRT
jgi:hypothetical protein